MNSTLERTDRGDKSDIYNRILEYANKALDSIDKRINQLELEKKSILGSRQRIQENISLLDGQEKQIQERIKDIEKELQEKQDEVKKRKIELDTIDAEIKKKDDLISELKENRRQFYEKADIVLRKRGYSSSDLDILRFAAKMFRIEIVEEPYNPIRNSYLNSFIQQEANDNILANKGEPTNE